MSFLASVSLILHFEAPGAPCGPSSSPNSLSEAQSLAGVWGTVSAHLQMPGRAGVARCSPGTLDLLLEEASSGSFCVLASRLDPGRQAGGTGWELLAPRLEHSAQLAVTDGWGPGGTLGAHQCLSDWTFLDNCQGLSLSEYPWKPQGKGVSPLHPGPKTHSHVKICQ